MRLRVLIAVLSTISLIAAPAAAQAATKSVGMGLPPKSAKRFQERYSSDSNNFYPATISIRAGDSVRFLPYGFHNVDLPKRGSRAAVLFTPAGTATGVNDAAGAPFWFNGQPTLGFNPALLKSGYGKKFTYTGAKAVNSGLPLGPRLKAVTVRFPRRGSYTYFCDIHPGMKGKVNVRSRRARVPSARADARAVARQLVADERAARSFARATAPDRTVLLGTSNARGVEQLAMVPAKLTVPVGSTVDFRMKSTSREVHTATFGPGANDPDKEPNSYVGEVAKTFQGPGPFDGRATYPSDPPGTIANLTPALHGNGFWNSGVLDAVPGSPPPPTSRLTFGQAGTYPYVCLIHTHMRGTITVQ